MYQCAQVHIMHHSSFVDGECSSVKYRIYIFDSHALSHCTTTQHNAGSICLYKVHLAVCKSQMRIQTMRNKYRHNHVQHPIGKVIQFTWGNIRFCPRFPEVPKTEAGIWMYNLELTSRNAAIHQCPNNSNDTQMLEQHRCSN